jgi:hypothetical protein
MIVWLGATANAATLITPFVSSRPMQIPFVVVTNVGTSPLTVSVSCNDQFGASVAPVLDSCTGIPVDPVKSCFQNLPNDVDVFCTISGSSAKMRASLSVYDVPSDSYSVVPATKK